MAFISSIKVVNNFNFVPLYHFNKFSTSTVLCKSIRLKELDKSIPLKKRWNYMRSKTGFVKKLDRDLIGSGIHNVPFDLEKADLVSPKEVHPSKWGGSMEVMKRISSDPARFGHQPGYLDADEKFVLVEEMIPEFVVPNLTDCSLLPYVPYNIELIDSAELSPAELFKITYGQAVVSRRHEISGKDLDIYLDKFLESCGCSREDVQAHGDQEPQQQQEERKAQGAS